jgi:hypothetical protein
VHEGLHLDVDGDDRVGHHHHPEPGQDRVATARQQRP